MPTADAPTQAEIAARVAELGDWFHNLNLRGVRTAPDHFLGDYPAQKFRHFASAVPDDLGGKSVLDIGCNAGFYSLEMRRRGASRVVGIDSDDRYLAQARYAAEVETAGDNTGCDVEFRNLSVYDVAALRERFDLVIFMGVLYHLRHPLLALDLIREHACKPDGLLLFQSMQRGGDAVEPVEADYDFWQTNVFDRPGWPRMSFVEHRYSGDQTNWWVPNAACSAAMLRSAGFAIEQHPEPEVFLCRVAEQPEGPNGGGAVYPARGA